MIACGPEGNEKPGTRIAAPARRHPRMPVFESESIVVDRDADGSLALIIDVPGRPLNVLTRGVLADLERACDAVAGLGKVPLIYVRSGKRTGFLAGADLHGFLGIQDAAAARALSEAGQKAFDRVAALPAPTIAAISGPCLGGGLELALACDYRIVFDGPKTQLGLPEVELGLLPAWGGTQRLPRVVGLEPALRMILTARRLNAREAVKWGLADAVAASEAELRDGLRNLAGRALGEGKRKRDKLPLRTWKQKLLESNPVGRRVIFQGTERQVRKKVPDDMPAPGEAIEAVRTGIKQGMTAGLAREREAVGRLALTPACRNLVGLFFAREQARKQAGEGSPVKRVGVVGAGVMGAGIAQLAALRGCDVVVQEVNQGALESGMKRLDELFQKAAGRVVSPAEAEARRRAVRGTLKWEGFEAVDLVVEAAVEELELKRALFRELEARTGTGTVLATNTSSLRVATLQEGLRHPERVAGAHFFNPVHKMPLVEVVRAPATGPQAVDLLQRWASALGKTPVVVGDGPGFVVNRVLMPYLNESVLLVGEGLAIEEVDRLMRRFGMPLGPLGLLDQVGLDVAAHVARSMQPALAGRFEPNDAFEKMRARGWLGVKSGTGFYLHRGKKPSPNRAAEALLREGKVAPAVKLPKAALLADARERLVLGMVNESALVLGEGLADAESIDLAMVFGTGWAPHRGGPLRYADDRGLPDVMQALEGLAARHGPRFAPAEELKRRAAAREPFRRPVG
jgi:3-hydroxyacyl-CoA dehydrogenase/enoyl-CoA hydratase/3-hydroxybutyryl-CoA epimerase